MFRLRTFFGLASLLTVATALGHGMNKPGPNGGFIRMPGAFHTELVPQSDNQFRVYLLDEALKNPTTGKSSLSGRLKKKDKDFPIQCDPRGDHFLCLLPPEVKASPGDKYVFQGSRKGARGGNAVYDLPFRLAVF